MQAVFPSMATQFSSARSQSVGYRPLGSVWEGDDAELLELLLDFYPRKRPKRILDATVNGGRFWRGSSRPVYGLDIEVSHRPHIAADNTRMPFRDDAFDVVVYDPPHIPNQGKDNEKDFNVRFGLVVRSPKENVCCGGAPRAGTRGCPVLQDYGLRPSPSLQLGARRFHRRRTKGWLSRVRLHRQDAKRPDHRSQMEDGPPYSQAALLLAHFPKIR